MILKVMGWNIHGAASMGWSNGYIIEEFIVNRIIKENLEEAADIIVISEFVLSKGWDYFQKRLEATNYIWFMAYTSGSNGIFIAVKKEKLDNSNLTVNHIYRSKMISTSADMMTTQLERPNLLQVKLNINNKELCVIGSRIAVLDDNATEAEKVEYKAKQFKALDDHLSSLIGNVLCIGDFNAYWNNCWNTNQNSTLPLTSKTYNLNTPVWKPNANKHSYVLKSNKSVSFDHIITKNVSISKLDYIWDFVCKSNGYGKLKTEDYKTHLKGLPDHAILTAEVDL